MRRNRFGRRLFRLPKEMEELRYITISALKKMVTAETYDRHADATASSCLEPLAGARRSAGARFSAAVLIPVGPDGAVNAGVVFPANREAGRDAVSLSTACQAGRKSNRGGVSLVRPAIAHEPKAAEAGEQHRPGNLILGVSGEDEAGRQDETDADDNRAKAHRAHFVAGTPHRDLFPCRLSTRRDAHQLFSARHGDFIMADCRAPLVGEASVSSTSLRRRW
jgi:hypothetical protein